MTASVLRESHTPAELRIPDDASLTTLLRDRAAADPHLPYGAYRARGEWIEVPLREFAGEVWAAARGLIAQGIAPGDCVGLMASTRYEWALLDFAIQAAGAITVPIYQTASTHQLEWIHEDAELALLIVENADNLATAEAMTRTPRTLVIDAEHPAVAELAAAGAEITDAQLARATAAVRADDVATIVYTSGTTGRPKGVELTHRNFVEHAMNAAAHADWGRLAHDGSRVLLFLPLAHVFARHMQVLALACGTVVGFSPSTKTLAEDLRSFRPTWLMVVPRVLETFYNTIDARTGGGVKQRLFRWAAGVARRGANQRARGTVSPAQAVSERLARALVLRKVSAALGGQVRYVVSGGARLSPSLAEFFTGIGVTVMEGYGTTELAAPHTCNPPSDSRTGTVGIPFPGCTVRIADDGEVLAQGPNVFAGYRGNREATAEAFRDGWYATGDLGEIDADGYLTIVGRKKEIIVTAGGKNVQPAGLEDMIRPSPLVQEVVVVGEGRPFVGALMALDEAMTKAWLAAKGLPAMTIAEAAAHPAVRQHLQTVIDAANATVSRAEHIREWRVLPRELTAAAEEMSASLKVRRREVLAHFADVVEELYAGRRPATGA